MSVTAAESLSTALKSQRVEGVVEALYRNDEVMGEFPMRPFTGGGTINVTMHYAGNTSVGRYTEGDATGVAGSQSYLYAAWPEQHYKGVVEITGHAMDYLVNGSSEAAFFSQLSEEIPRCINDMKDYITQDMLGSGTVAPIGIQGICSSTGTIAGIARATYSWFAAYQTNGAATTVAVADLDGMMQALNGTAYKGRISAIWTSWKQAKKLKGVYGNPGVANAPVRVIADGSAGYPQQMGSVEDPQFYGAIPIKKKSDLTDSIFLFLQESDFFIGKMRGFTVKQLGATGDSDKFQLTAALSLGCLNPKHQGKLDTLTA